MTSMRILIFGSDGWIGSLLKEYFVSKGHHIIGISHKLFSYQQIYNIVRYHSPTHVLITLGRTTVSKRQSDGFAPDTPMILPPVSEESSYGLRNTIDGLELRDSLFRNLFDNLLVPQWIAEACRTMGNIHCTYIGTGCIFHYRTLMDNGDIMVEDSMPNFVGSSYSAVKSITDQWFHQTQVHVLNVRIRLPIAPTPHPRNLLNKILSYRTLYDIPNSVTYLPTFYPILEDYMETERTGTVHFVNRNPVRLSEIYQILIDVLGCSCMPMIEVPSSVNMVPTNGNAIRSQNAIIPKRLFDDGYNVSDVLDMLRDDLKNIPYMYKRIFQEIEHRRLNNDV